MKVFLGIDTSCYTTSVAVLDEAGKLAAEARRILQVKAGDCGLMQHEMVFQHTRALPELMRQVWKPEYELAGIGVSGSPRPGADSYMPAFLPGLGTAKNLATVTGVPLLVESHQENHLLAGLWSNGRLQEPRFLMLHASGGTTDLLLAERESAGRYKLTPAGGSMDLHAGQFIDRVGVALELQFPTGPALEKLGAAADGLVELPVCVKQTQVSLSGPATAALRLLAGGAAPAALARGVEHCLAVTFGRMLRNAGAVYAVRDVLLVGGVAANQYLRKVVEEIISKRGMRLYCGAPEYSCDNAAGNACAAWLTLRR